MTIKVGTAGGSDINVDFSDNKNIATVQTVTLSADYITLCPYTLPFRPGFTGAATLDYPRTILSGSVITVLKGEAAALIAAGKAT
jgi:hypothetical protein